MTKADYYKTLGVERGADETALKSAYRKLAKQYHPDRNQGDGAAEKKFKDVSEAYDVLKDPQKRAAYDRFGHEAFQNGGMGGGGGGRGARGNANFGDINDIFEQFFGGRAQGRGNRGGGRRRPAQQRGRDLQMEIEIDLLHAYSDSEREINIDAPAPCKSCNGTGGKEGAKPEPCKTCNGAGAIRTQRGFMTMEQLCPQCQGQGHMISEPCKSCNGQGRTPQKRKLTVRIPAGVDTGTRIRLAGEGEAGLRGAPAGDFFVFVNIAPHAFLAREGSNLFCEMPVPMTLAANGGQVDVPLLDGKRVKLTIPAGAQSGQQFRLRGKGMPVLQRQTHGDLYVRIEIEVPEGLDTKQQALVKELEKSLSDKNYPQAEAFKARTK